MEDVTRTKYFNQIFKPIISISKFVGLTFISGNHISEKDKILKLYSILRLVYQLILGMTLTTASMSVIYLNNSGIGKDEDIHLFQMQITNLTAVINLFVTQFKTKNNVEDVLRRMLLLDKLLKTDDATYINNARFIKKLIITFMPLVMLFTLLDFVTYASDYVSLLYTIAIDFSIIIHLIFVMQYVSFIYLIRERLKLLNSYILTPKIINKNSRRILYSDLGIININTDTNLYKLLLSDELSDSTDEQINSETNFGTMVNSFDAYRLKLHFQLLRVAQEVLCDISSSINIIYGFQVLLLFVMLFTEPTCNLYYVILHIATGSNLNKETSINVLVTAPLWVSFYFFIILFVTGLCNLTSNEAKRTGILLQRLQLIPELQTSTLNEVQHFLHQVSHRKIKFTAWDIFTIDLKLLGSIVGTITTLLVILIQFNKIV
ncbi:hypothetical protein L9F63_009820 [Diploptera punctata]|uniref:Gustatory receptor n=1 Tax=Diploptera punctata TaxID=6984 RepID=A0AAD8ALI4_DIPPU|nr:hypothetical protein L9F63_009820 [Diploptera punctata]